MPGRGAAARRAQPVESLGAEQKERRVSQYVPCPRCGCDQAAKVSFTWWGGFLGPSLFHHVRCPGCGTTFNGQTGRSNNTAITVYLVVGGCVGVGLLILILSLL